MGARDTLDPNSPGDLPEIILPAEEPDGKTRREKLRYARDIAIYTAYLWGLAPANAGISARTRIGPVINKNLERAAIGLTGAAEAGAGAALALTTPPYVDPLEGVARAAAVTYLLVDGGVRTILGFGGRDAGGLLPSIAKYGFDWAKGELADYRERRAQARIDSSGKA